MSSLQIFKIFFYLGCISFGGPAAHLSLFQKELVEKRSWLSVVQYTQLMSLCQTLPGPSSSQVGMALGYHQAGYKGAFAAWFGFTLPGAILLALMGLGVLQLQQGLVGELIHGLKLAVLVIVAHAIISMMRQICVSIRHYFIVLMIGGAALFGQFSHLSLMLISAVLGIVFFRQNPHEIDMTWLSLPKRQGALLFALFLLLLLGLPFIFAEQKDVSFFNIFYQAGALVFGGGHVVLPLLEKELVNTWVDAHTFIAGYALAQTVPGPLFNFSSYLGVVSFPSQPLWGVFLAVIGIFLPAALILFSSLAYVHYLNRSILLRAAFMGVSAGVIGILVYTLYQPLYVSSVHHMSDLLLALFAFLLLQSGRVSVIFLVLMCAFIALFI